MDMIRHQAESQNPMTESFNTFLHKIGKTGIGPYHQRIHPGVHYHEVLHDKAHRRNVCVVYVPCV